MCVRVLMNYLNVLMIEYSFIEKQKFLNSKGYLGMNGKPATRKTELHGRNTNYALRLYT